MNKIYEILEVKKRNQLEEKIYKNYKNFSDKECFNYNHCMKRKCKDCSKMKNALLNIIGR